jgi:hypothetical protein
LTELDWIIVAFCVLMAAIGWRQGFVAGAFALIGLCAGGFAGSRLAPALLSSGASSPYAPLITLVGALVGGTMLAGLLEGAGFLLRRSIPIPGLRTFDGALGAALSVAIALGLAWLAGAVALQTPGARGLRRDIQRSEILSRLNSALPPSGPVLNALARFDPFPRVEGPEANVGPPPEGIAGTAGVRAAGASVVRILGTACGLGVEGSGWVAGNGLVVTNAHVVAGETDTVVLERGFGSHHPARAVSFDPVNDVAVLDVGGLDAPALTLADDPETGTPGAVLGFPENGPYTVRGARLGATRTVISQDAYGRGPVSRPMTSFRGIVRPGNSGGPVVDGAGRVLTTVFAQSTGGGPQGGYGVPNAVVRRELQAARSAGGTVSTGPCTR